jgi:hypothetical protein
MARRADSFDHPRHAFIANMEIKTFKNSTAKKQPAICRSGRVSTKLGAGCQPSHTTHHAAARLEIFCQHLFSFKNGPRALYHSTCPAQPPWATPHLSHFQKVCLKDHLAEAVADFFPALGRLQRTESASRSRGIP